jgi:2-(1,2-epoxy-1,2-dihydrophenyl)acetyl-CoA isomerase
VGASRALDLLVNNVAVDARRALEIGLVDRVVRDADFAAAWMAWAAQFADGPRTAIGYIKDNIGNASRMSLAEAIAIEAEHQVDSSLTDDHRQAVKAWIEKRDPVFRRDET